MSLQTREHFYSRESKRDWKNSQNQRDHQIKCIWMSVALVQSSWRMSGEWRYISLSTLRINQMLTRWQWEPYQQLHLLGHNSATVPSRPSNRNPVECWKIRRSGAHTFPRSLTSSYLRPVVDTLQYNLSSELSPNQKQRSIIPRSICITLYWRIPVVFVHSYAFARLIWSAAILAA